ncbi:VOC family protein [Paenibacillus barcinonensis]|uniref:Putative glyoxalase superfamily protein PhnB n=1 Tax=Paenibacillus barcinonensis TaxID=198119 RepID=A0A2V4URV8_PAEBA|nr:VOC family protein [Paenibacillus barcinonensis]PYE42813.1 putative glyoxalase superfamily protein PhnB [Paenibacillus barcinonensis]QKS57179.1 VOC family protein [Paenibacillus barcinonensis]
MNGNAAEAIEFTYPPGQDEYITHSVLQVGVNKLMIAEEAMDVEKPWLLGNSTSMCIQSQDQGQIDHLYEALLQHAGVKVLVPYERNESSPGYGIVRDPFGVVIQLCVTVHHF